MHRLFLIISLSLSIPHQKDGFELKADMKKDNEMLTNQHGLIVDKSGLKEFKTYANMDLSIFRRSEQRFGEHHILKWISKSETKLTIYEIKSIIPSDTVYQEKALVLDSVSKKHVTVPGKKISLKQTNFIFHTYIIQPAGGKQLIYVTEHHEGLMEYHIGNRIFYPIREDIALGLKKPDLNDIFKLITIVK